MPETKKWTGGCHCGAVRYEAEASLANVISCNCSICQKQGLILTFVPKGDFRLLKGDDAQSDYLFNRKMIHHLFCKTCGVASFALGQKPDGTEMAAINVRCLDDIDLETLKPKLIDGKSF